VPLLLLVSGIAQASNYSAVETKLKAAMAADIRTGQEVERNENRMPISDNYKGQGNRNSKVLGSGHRDVLS